MIYQNMFQVCTVQTPHKVFHSPVYVVITERFAMREITAMKVGNGFSMKENGIIINVFMCAKYFQF